MSRERVLEELEPALRQERERCLRVIGQFERALGDHYLALYNRIRNGNDPDDPEFNNDRPEIVD